MTNKDYEWEKARVKNIDYEIGNLIRNVCNTQGCSYCTGCEYERLFNEKVILESLINDKTN